MKSLILIWAIFYSSFTWAVAPYGVKGQSQTQTIYPNVNQVPYNQVTRLSGINSLFESDSENMLVNPNFESPTIASGWTLGTSNTLTASTVSTNVFSGKQAGLLTTSATVAFSLKQDVTPPSGLAGTQGEITWAIMVPAGVTDAKFCSRVSGTTSTVNCISLINNGIYKEYSLPFTFGTAGQTAGVELLTTATYASGSQTITVDKARVRANSQAGLGTVTVDTDPIVYTPTLSAFGAVSAVNFKYVRHGPILEEWGSFISGTPTTSTIGIDLPGSLVTIPTTSTYLAGDGSRSNTANASNSFTMLGISSSATVPFGIRSSAGTNALSAIGASSIVASGDLVSVHFSVPIAGWSSNANTFSAANANYDPISYTPAIVGLGTLSPSSNMCKQSRQGGDLIIRCDFTTGTTTGVLASISLPGSLTLDASRIIPTNTTSNPGSAVGWLTANANNNTQARVVTATGTSTSLLYLSNTTTGSTALVPQLGTSTFSSAPYSIDIRVPIAGWSNQSSIVATVAGYGQVPAVASSANQNIDIFDVSYGTTNFTTICSANPCLVGQIGTAVSSIGWTSAGLMTLNTSRQYLKLQCEGVCIPASGHNCVLTPITYLTGSATSSFSFTSEELFAALNSYGTLHCIGNY